MSWLERFDRAAWAALSQREPGTWSWPRALGTAGASIAVGVVVYFTAYREPAFLGALVAAYALLIVRARRAYERVGERRG